MPRTKPLDPIKEARARLNRALREMEAALSALPVSERRAARKVAYDMLNDNQRTDRYAFSVGQRVSFPFKSGQRGHGVITKVNTRTCTVKDPERPHGRGWNVPPALLTVES